jgi:predicted ribosome quality control (RQC) complex YloA/Tae2 family protein
MTTPTVQTQTENLPIKVEEFTSIIQTAPMILKKNQESVQNCEKAAKALLDTIEGNGGIDSDELDEKVSTFIAKAKITVKNMNTRRSPLTQLLTKVAKEFTTLENKINPTNAGTSSAKLQTYRDKYAAKKIAQQKAIEEAERRRQATENEKLEYRTELTLSMQKYYTVFFEERAVELENLFAGLTLSNFDKQSKQVVEFSTVYNAIEHFKGFRDDFRFVYLQNDDINKIKVEVVPPLLEDCKKRFRDDIQSMKDDLVIRLPSKRKDLERIEELRKQDAEAAARAEEATRKREEEEQKKREEEQKKREAEEKLRLEAQAAQADIFASFNQTAAAAPTTISTAKVTKKINVHNAKGFLEVYQMWFIGEGATLPLAELEKIHKKMITFCEKKANKDDEFIQSVFVEYVDEVKAK